MSSFLCFGDFEIRGIGVFIGVFIVFGSCFFALFWNMRFSFWVVGFEMKIVVVFVFFFF